jgi:3'-5' exoribonuclease
MNLFKNLEKKWINDLKVGEQVDEYFKITGLVKKTKRDGAPYLALELMDKTGKMQAKIWDNVESYLQLIREGEIYRVSGSINEFMGQKEVKVDKLSNVPANTPKMNPRDYTEEAPFDTDKTFDQLMSLVNAQVHNPHLLRLAELFSAKYRERFKQHYGAQKIHHAYVGGLLAHTYSIAQLAVQVADHYRLDKELLIMGTLFHDIGKLFEYTSSPAVSPTLEGGLIGHLVLGNNIFLELKSQIPDFPEKLGIMLQHLILSHHGEKEFGSPEVPKTPEAYALHVIDQLDSKMRIFEETRQNADGKQLFSDYLHVLSRRIYLPQEE